MQVMKQKACLHANDDACKTAVTLGSKWCDEGHVWCECRSRESPRSSSASGLSAAEEVI